MKLRRLILNSVLLGFAALHPSLQAAEMTRPDSHVRSVGSCMVVSNYPVATVNLQNSFSADAVAESYFYEFEGKRSIDAKNAKVNFVSSPLHGQITKKSDELIYYKPDAGYFGKDRAITVVAVAGYQVRIRYEILVLDGDLGSDAIEQYCKHGLIWKIAQ